MVRVLACPGCGGRKTIPCPVCDGRGYIQKQGSLGELVRGQRVDCPECKGVKKFRCKMCGGVGSLLPEAGQADR